MSKSEFRLCSIAVVYFLLLLSAVPSRAQVLYGSIVGNVRDASDAAIAAASVTITNTETGQTRQTATNETGAYSFPTVQAGQYEVRIAKEGFTTFTRSNVDVTINSVARVDVALTLGAVTESVTVAAEGAVLQTDRSEVRAEIDNKQLVDLPGALTRNYQYLLNTIPGVAPFDIREANPSNATGSSIFNVNGASNQLNNTRIDGASTTNIWQPQYTAYTPALESIRTVNVVTNSYDAEQGLAGGAAINVELKGGTNAFHGSLFEWLRGPPFVVCSLFRASPRCREPYSLLGKIPFRAVTLACLLRNRGPRICRF